MELINHTPFPADIARTQLFYQDLLMAIVVVKATYYTDDNGMTHVDPNPIPLQEKDEETPFGNLEGDYAIIKNQADVAVFGQAYAPDRKAVEQMEVTLSIDQFQKKLKVFGDRQWVWEGGEEGEGSFKPSSPEPFLTMPVTYANAYGGVALLDEAMEGSYHDNPFGKGYVTQKDHVNGTQLPNIESPDELIGQWTDQPKPAGFAPLPRVSPLRGLRGLNVDLEAQKTTCDPECFSCAHPDMILPRLETGKEISLKGMTPEGIWRFALPDIRMGLQVSLGESVSCFTLCPDTLCLFPEEKRFFILFRRSFVYPFKREQLRTTQILDITNQDDHQKNFFKKNQIDKSLQKADQDPEDPIALIPIMDEKLLSKPYSEFMDNYPLNNIILELPVCKG